MAFSEKFDLDPEFFFELLLSFIKSLASIVRVAYPLVIEQLLLHPILLAQFQNLLLPDMVLEGSLLMVLVLDDVVFGPLLSLLLHEVFLCD